MRYTLLILALCLLGTPLLAQRKDDVQQQYLRAKSLFQQQQWVPAMETFRQVAADPNAGGFSEYASFYYAISAIKSGRMEEAKAMLRQLKQKSPQWERQEEVNYWLARVYFEEANWEQAVAMTEGIKNRTVKADAEDMARFFLQRGASVEQLKRVLNQNPNAVYVADVLARKISSQPIVDQDQRLLAELINKYKLNKDLISKPATFAKSVMKPSYNVALMMPFLLENLQAERNIREIYFPLDVYEGMKLAQQDLAAEGITINLYAFDTKKDSLTTVKYLRSPEMKSMDLIVGPLFPGPSKAALEYSFNNGVNIVNPISNNPEIIQNNPYSFLFKPSLQTQGRKAADFASRTFSPNNALVIYGTKDRDTLMANAYRKELMSKGFRNIRMEQIKPGDEKRLRSLLVSDVPSDMQAGGRLSREAIGHVFIASEDEGIVAHAMNTLASRKDKLPVLGHEMWVRKNLVATEVLDRMGVYILAPDFVDYTKPDFFAFRDKYLEKVHAMPSRYAYLGYDMLMYFGRMMQRHGDLFQTAATQELSTSGVACVDFNFQNYRDNQCVPIIQYRASVPEIVYQ